MWVFKYRKFIKFSRQKYGDSHNKATVLEKKYPNQIFNSFYTDNIYDDRFIFDSANTVYCVKGKIKIKIK